MSVQIKNKDDIEAMRKAGRMTAEILDFITPYVKPGVTTDELDALCSKFVTEVQKGYSPNLNYAPPGHVPFPKSICTSPNHVVCHGIPSDRKLKDGDILNIDGARVIDGYYGDTSRMFHVGKPTIQGKRLVEATYVAMWRGIRAVKPGATLGDIGHAIQSYVEPMGFSVVREFCGHGIGRKYHEEPQVLHYGKPGTGMRLLPGMMFTIEPMINAGKAGTRVLADGWTAVTADHSLSAQWEHTILVTEDGFEVTTLSAGSPPPPPL
jgi:methionyl aminopeptidase